LDFFFLLFEKQIKIRKKNPETYDEKMCGVTRVKITGHGSSLSGFLSSIPGLNTLTFHPL